MQLYIRDDVGSVAQPVKALKGFERVTLAAGETKTVRFTVSAEALALYDSALRRVVEPGTFTIYVGGSSESVHEARLVVTGDPLVLEQAPTRAR
ncbi:MAG: fibronectin type III-like domain-contianing protein [Actinomycetota bacterium]|nr:fibronectin type III-like domain-contianing protein [Actinomycetota bacterium]